MNNLSLTACSIWLRTKNLSKKNSIEIINLNQSIINKKNKENKYEDFFDIIKKFCSKYSNFVSDDVDQKMFKINTKEIEIKEENNFKYTFIDVKSGGYGIDAEIINRETNEISYTRTKNHAEIMNFKVFFAVPKGNDVCKGIILFQNIGQYGIKTITTDCLSKFISEEMDLVTTTGNICPEIFVKKILEYDGLKKIVYTRNNISNDKADIEDIGYGREERIIMGFSNINKWKERLSGYLNGKNRIYEFENTNYDGVKFVTSIYGRQRTIDINNIKNVSVIEGIPDEIMNSFGDINEEELKKHFIKVTDEYLEHMVYNKI